jgi:dTDP-4-dehydrorhamnose 3,5-epimerase
MTFRETGIDGAFLIEPDSVADARGVFSRVFRRHEFGAHGLAVSFAQVNESFSREPGTLRGLHYQAAPHEEAKLIRCIRGQVFDVIVDMRPKSRSFLEWFGCVLTPDSGLSVYIPEGCAHGYLAMTHDSGIVYLSTGEYRAESERGVRWDDPAVAIRWPAPGVRAQSLSSKDRAWPDLLPCPA